MIDSKIIDAFIRNPDSISVKSYHSIAKIISALENGFTIPHQFFNGNTAKNENCVTVGITGGAGAGKSSFINKLISYIVQQHKSSVHDITDIYFINKNDIHDTNRVKTSIEEYLELMKQYRKTTPAIFCGNAINGEGIEEVYKVLSKKLKNGSNIE